MCIRKISNIFLAIMATLGIMYYITTSFNATVINNIICIPVLILYYNLYSKMEKDKKTIIFSGVISIIYAIILIIGAQLELTSDIQWGIKTTIKILLFVFSLFPIFYKLIKYITQKEISIKEVKIKSERKLFWCVYGILLVFGIFGFLALYPGQFGYDAGYQIMQIQYDDVTITTHFSVIYSYILYGFIEIGKNVFNSYDIGLALYAFFQMCIITYVTSKICMFTYKLSKNRYFLLGTLIFFAIFPLHIIMMLSTAQDTIFSGILALIVMESYNLIIKPEEYFNKIKNPIRYIVLTALLCMFRNNGLYAILFAMLFAVIFAKKYRLKTIIMYIIAISMFLIYKGPVFSALNVVDVDSIREMSSIPCQQIARTYTYNKDVFSEADKSLLLKMFSVPEEELFQYYEIRSSISDSVKSTLNEEYTKENLKPILEMYVSTAIKDPENYTEAFLLNSLGFWYPNKNYPDTRIYHPYIESKMLESKLYNERYIEYNRKSLFPLYNKVLELIVTKDGWKRIPIISILFPCGTYFLLLLFTIFLSIYKKEYKILYPLSVILGYYATLLLSPVCIFRYCYGLILCAPILISICLKKNIDKGIKDMDEIIN